MYSGAVPEGPLPLPVPHPDPVRRCAISITPSADLIDDAAPSLCGIVAASNLRLPWRAFDVAI